MRSLLVLAALGGLLAGCGGDDETAEVSTESGGFEAPAEAWEQLPESPLSPRATSVAVAVGGEVIVVGGDTFLCPPNASCAPPTEPPLADGAAIDLTTGTWRTISPAPVAFSYADTAVLDDSIYYWIQDPVRGTRSMLRYDVGDDSWSEVAPPPDGSPWLYLLSVGDRLVAYAGEDEVAEATLLFDPVSESWSALPEDPLEPSHSRTMAWDGQHLYLFAMAESSVQPGVEPSLARSARLDLDGGTWEQLADSETIGSGPWLVEGTRIVMPVSGSADGGETNNWGRSYPYGAVYDTAANAWSNLPPLPDDTLSAGALGSASAVYLSDSGALLDVTTMSWLEMPALDDDDGIIRRVVTAGADAFVFGGERWDGDEGELLGDAWIWRSGRGTPASPATTNPTAPSTTAPGATVPPTTGASTTTSPDGAAVELSQTGGCADVYFWAASADGTEALTLYVDVRDRSSTEPTELDLALPDPAATVTLQRGSDLTQAFCNDVLDQDYELDEEAPVVEGTLHLTVDPLPAEAGGFVTGTATLTGLVAEDGTRIADLEITTDMIGMHAG